MASQVDLLIIALAVILPLLFWFRESIPFIGKPKGDEFGRSAGDSAAAEEEEGDPRDFVGKMTRAVSGL